ncbi:MAG: hypothetical protein GY714_23965 [Desulfobacterales bacterium]|nr:hypothetical protein [Desulfobacterales bacterium]
MGSVIARTAIKQAMKQGGRAIAKNIGKQAIKKLALRGVKTEAKGGAIVATGLGVDAGLRKLTGGVKRKRKKRLQSTRKKSIRKKKTRKQRRKKR